MSGIERVGSVMKRNQRRTRDREPSRVPVRRVLKALKRKLSRQKIRSLLTNSVPKTSFIRFLCCNYKYWRLWYERENYFSKHVFFFNKSKICNVREASVLMPAVKSQVSQVLTTCSTLKGGVLADESVTGNFAWACLSDRLKHINLMPHDVGGSGDCFFKSVSHQLYGTADLHFQTRMSGIGH